jgi:uncharacterized protein (TIGR03437 family)
MRILAIIITVPLLCCGQGVISTVAGNGTNAYAGDGGPAISASLHPNGVTVDDAGNIYIADLSKSVIRKVNAAGVISTFAGFATEKNQFSGDGGPAIFASIYIASNHNGMAVDAAGNVYIADDGHHRIRKVDTSGIITTVAGNGQINFSGDGGAATGAALWRPSGVAVDAAGNLYIADTNNVRIRKVDTHGVISTVAGSGAIGNGGDGGLATKAALFYPMGVAVDGAGNIYIGDQNAYVVRKVNTAGIISTVAGNGDFGFSGDGGQATNAETSGPYDVAVDRAGNLYFADHGNHRVRKVDTSGVITTIAGGGGGGSTGIGDGGPPTSANLDPAGVAVDSAGNYYIADEGNNRIRKVTVGAHVPGLLTTAGSLYFSQTAGGNSTNAQIVTISTAGSVALHLSVAVSTSSGGDWLAETVAAGLTPAQMTVFIKTDLGVGTYKGTVTITPAAPDLPVINIPVTYVVTTTPPARPVITSIVNGASFQNGVVGGSWATILGTNLASTSDNWNKAIANGQLPTSLDGVTVLFDGMPAYPSFISPTQINVVVPNIRTDKSLTAVVVSNSGAKVTSIFNAPSAAAAPAFFLWPNAQVVATRLDYTYAVKDGTFAGFPTVAAKPGDVLVLWGTGFGTTTPAPPVGFNTPGDPTYSTSTLPSVTVDNIPAKVYGAALAPGLAALYQVAIQVPDSLSDGDWPIQASIGGAQSPTGTILTVKK